MAPVIELPLPRHSLFLRAELFGVNQTDRTVLEHVRRAPSFVVGFQAGLEVLC